MNPLLNHLPETYESELSKTASVWRCFHDSDLTWRPHPRSSTVGEVMKHQLLSERRFFSEFLGREEVEANEVLPATPGVDAFVARLVELATPRIEWIASRTEQEWIERVRFFDVDRERIWVFWRRVLHTAHHRTQLTVYLRLLDRVVPSTYGPTADVTWTGASPTLG
jgi:uncharacterized damage-inducible protein DinB